MVKSRIENRSKLLRLKSTTGLYWHWKHLNARKANRFLSIVLISYQKGSIGKCDRSIEPSQNIAIILAWFRAYWTVLRQNVPYSVKLYVFYTESIWTNPAGLVFILYAFRIWVEIFVRIWLKKWVHMQDSHCQWSLGWQFLRLKWIPIRIVSVTGQSMSAQIPWSAIIQALERKENPEANRNIEE